MSGDEAEGREAQWASAEEAFLERTKDTEGMSAEKYQRIKDLIRSWDDLSISERRERAGGNQAYWREKYSFLETVDGEGELLLLPAGDKGEEGAALKPQPVICSHQGRFFEDIKAVHLASVPRPPPPSLVQASLVQASLVQASSASSCARVRCLRRREPCERCSAVQSRVRQAWQFNPPRHRTALREALPRVHPAGAWQLPPPPSPLRAASPSCPLRCFA